MKMVNDIFANGTTCMWMRRVDESTTVHEKQFHACDNSEMLMKTKMVLGQDNIHVNDNKYEKKSRKYYSYK